MKKLVICLILFSLLIGSMNIASSFLTSSSLKVVNNNEEKTRFDYEDKYAVIIVGTYGTKNQEKITGAPREQYYEWYTGSAQKRFDMLTEDPRYNFDPANIYVLLTEIHKDGYTPSSSFDSSKFINYYNATKENITLVFNNLKELIDENDLLLVDLISHGGDDNARSIPFYTKKTGKLIDDNYGINAHDTYIPLEKGETESEDQHRSRSIILPFFNRFFMANYNNATIATDSESLYDHELASLTDQINARRVIFILQPCHSGGFINDLSKDNHIIIAACDEGEVAGNFLGPLNKGLSGLADSDGDNKISVAEAFIYAHDNVLEYYPDIFPLIEDGTDKEGSEIPGEISYHIFDFSYEQI